MWNKTKTKIRIQGEFKLSTQIALKNIKRKQLKFLTLKQKE
jgi:hypothetical protein